MEHVAGQLVLQFQLFFLQAVEKIFIRVGSMLFLFDESMERRMLRLDFLDRNLFHRCHSFRECD